MSVAPVLMTVMGSTPGARVWSLFRSRLLKTDCPVPKEVEVPTQNETKEYERSVLVADHIWWMDIRELELEVKVYSHRSMAVLGGRSSGSASAWPAIMPSGSPLPRASPARTW